MGSYNTTLCLVNFSGKDITSTAITIDYLDDWDYQGNDANQSRPDLNFGGPLPNGDARCKREEINSGTKRGCWFKIALTFADSSTLEFRANQWDAYAGKKKVIYTNSLAKSAQNAGLEVLQQTGESRYVYTNAYYIRPARVPDNSGWMSRLVAYNPNIPLNGITMPGSHDAGMYTTESSTEKSRTQSLSILQQLQAGVRYFDLRVCERDGDIWTYHGAFGAYGGQLRTILTDVRTFMDAGSQEAVFLKFRSYASGDREPTIRLVQGILRDHLYSGDLVQFAVQPLRQFCNRVLCVFHPDYDVSLLNSREGRVPYADYGNEDTGQFIAHPSTKLHFGVYDAYSHQSEFAVMEQDQQSKRDQFGGYGKDYLFLFSWTLTGSTDNILDIDLLSAAANAQLPRALSTKPDKRPNIVYIDQVDPWLCRRIIATNPGWTPDPRE